MLQLLGLTMLNPIIVPGTHDVPMTHALAEPIPLSAKSARPAADDPPAGAIAEPDEEVQERAKARKRLLLHMPVDIRSASLALIALILCLYALQWAQEIVVPILGGVMMSYALTPIVDRLERWKLPRAVGATLLLTSIMALVGWGAWALGDQTDALLDSVPTVTSEVRAMYKRATGQTSALARVQKAAADLASAAAPAAASGASGPPAAPVTSRRQVEPKPAAEASATGPAIDVRGYLLIGTLGLMSFLGKLAVILFVTLFLLSSGNTFRKKMVKLAGPKLSQKKVTVETLDEITEQIQRYLLVQAGVSVVVGVFTWLAFFGLGLSNAGVWGVVAAVTNLIPYAGALFVGAASAVFALVQFGSPQMALIVGGTSFGIHTVVGNVLTPWWMGRASKMSPVAVFVAVLVFGWLWGVWGLLLGVPILLAVKSVCDRVEDLKPIGELLGA